MTETFRALLLSKGITAAGIEALVASGLDTIEALLECDDADLAEAGLKVLGDKMKVRALRKSEGPQAANKTTSEEKLSPGFDSDAFFQSGSGLNLGSIKPRINADFAKLAADSVLAYSIVSTGILEVFDSAFWATIMLEDMQLRRRIHRWKELTRTQQYISNAARDELINLVPKLFPESFDQLILSARTMSAQLEASSLLGPQARINVTSEAVGLVALRDLIPLAAEGLSNAMISSEMPEQALAVVSMINDLVSLFKEPLLLASAGVSTYDSVDEGAILFLTRRFGQEIANKFRLALSYEQCVRAIAACPATESIDRNYLQVVGTLAGRLCNYYGLVVPGKSEEIRPFSNLKALMKKAAEQVAQEPSGQNQPGRKIEGVSSTGWPFPKFGSKVMGSKSSKVPMVVGPECGEFKSCTLPLVIVGSGEFSSCTITNLIWFGDDKKRGILKSCTVHNLYCLAGCELENNSCTLKMIQYKTRDELIALAVELAEQRNVQLL